LQQVDPEEASRRAAHMAEQRDRLIEMKRLERDKKVRIEAEKEALKQADGNDELSRIKEKIKNLEISEKNYNEISNDDKKRSGMCIHISINIHVCIYMYMYI
jgi:hypothetical protein